MAERLKWIVKVGTVEVYEMEDGTVEVTVDGSVVVRALPGEACKSRLLRDAAERLIASRDLLTEVDRLRAELAAYKRAKAENDERFQLRIGDLHAELLAKRDAVPECVQRWRENYRTGERGYILVDGLRMHAGKLGVPDHEPVAADCLEWLATTPSPALVLAAGAGDVEAILAGCDGDEGACCCDRCKAVDRAIIVDASEVREWLLDPYASTLSMPPALHKLMEGE